MGYPSEKSSGEDTVMIMDQEAEVLNHTIDEHLPVKLIEQKGILCDTLWPPMSPGQMNGCWRGRKYEAVKKFIFLFVFPFVFVCFL